jgi:hypothetical protein
MKKKEEPKHNRISNKKLRMDTEAAQPMNKKPKNIPSNNNRLTLGDEHGKGEKT